MSKKSSIFYILSGVSLIYCFVELSIGLVFTAVLGLLYPVLMLVAVGLLIGSAWKRKKSYLVHSLALVAMIVSSLFISVQIEKELHRKSIDKAGFIIQKVEAYRAEKGAYPGDLSDLNLSPIDMETDMGIFLRHEYRYVVVEEGYIISFEEPAWMVSSFHSKSGVWVKDD